MQGGWKTSAAHAAILYAGDEHPAAREIDCGDDPSRDALREQVKSDDAPRIDESPRAVS